MSSNLPLVHRSRRVLPWSRGLKLEINIPSQRIRAKWKGGLINEGGVISSEYGSSFNTRLHSPPNQQGHCLAASVWFTLLNCVLDTIKLCALTHHLQEMHDTMKTLT